MMKYKKIETPNKMLGRNGKSPLAFVIHITEGEEAGTIEWIKNPKSQVSYNFMIGRDGSIYEFVAPKNTAWANGLIKNSTWKMLSNGTNPNEYTISIAIAGFAVSGASRSQILALSELLAELSEKYKIPLDETHVITHNTIRTDKICPGQKVSIPLTLYLANLPT